VHRGTKDDSAGAMARDAARSERRESPDPPRRRERPEIRSLAGSQAPLYFTRLCANSGHAGARGAGDGCIDVAEKVVASPRVSYPPRGSRFAGDENRPDGDIRLGKPAEFIARSAFRESRWNNNAASDDSDERLTPPPAARANQIGHNARAFLRRETFYCLRESATPWRISRKCCQLSGLFSIK